MDTTTSSEAIYEIIMRRRDVRSEFTGDPIPRSTLDRVLKAAHAAPSVGLSQPWDFIVINARSTRERFRDHVLTERATFAASLALERAEAFANIKVEGILESSIGIVVTYDANRGAPDVLGRHTIADAGLYSTCLAIENLWLAATAEGYGVGWVSFYREVFLRRLLGIPDHVRPVAWLCMGPVTHLQDLPDLERHRWHVRTPPRGSDPHGAVVGGAGGSTDTYRGGKSPRTKAPAATANVPRLRSRAAVAPIGDRGLPWAVRRAACRPRLHTAAPAPISTKATVAPVRLSGHNRRSSTEMQTSTASPERFQANSVRSAAKPASGASGWSWGVGESFGKDHLRPSAASTTAITATNPIPTESSTGRGDRGSGSPRRIARWFACQCR